MHDLGEQLCFDKHFWVYGFLVYSLIFECRVNVPLSVSAVFVVAEYAFFPQRDFGLLGSKHHISWLWWLCLAANSSVSAVSHLATAWPHSISCRRAVALWGQGDRASLSSLRGPVSSEVPRHFEELQILGTWPFALLGLRRGKSSFLHLSHLANTNSNACARNQTPPVSCCCIRNNCTRDKLLLKTCCM